jgi:hypothetical protein
VRLVRATPGIWGRAVLLALSTLACGSRTLDAGQDVPHGLLPVDERNPVILSNDGSGNWYGLYAVLFSNAGGPSLAGIAINSSAYATNLEENLIAWQELVNAARASGMRGIPDPTGSVGAPLERPADGNIDSTVPNGSAGARLIVDVSARLAKPYRPVVVVAGGRLTDVADAYLLDHDVKNRVVVVASLGSGSAAGGLMGAPNGELDPWAGWIVTERFRYVQVCTFYDATIDLPASELGTLPNNPLGELVAQQQPRIAGDPTRADQVSILAVGLPEFVVTLENVEPDSSQGFDANNGPALVPSTSGRASLVTGIDPSVAGARLRQMLADPKTFGQ